MELGAKTIWLSPIYKSPMKVLGYDIEDFKEVDGSFGSLQDFKDLVQAIRTRGKRQCCSYTAVRLHASGKKSFATSKFPTNVGVAHSYALQPVKGLGYLHDTCFNNKIRYFALCVQSALMCLLRFLE